MQYHIEKPRNLTAKVSLPSSKSISNRALLLNTLSGAPMGCIANLSDCDDTTVMMEALFLLDAERREGRVGQLVPVINIKAAGTAMRFLTAYLAATPSVGTRVITGTERMCQRPIALLVDSLRTLGADIEYEGQEGFPPLRITGKTLRGGQVNLPGDVSSQYISALLMIAPLLEEGLSLSLQGTIISRPYINMTMQMMREHGAEVAWQDSRTIVVKGGKGYVATPYYIESDWSAASYWYEMELLSDNLGETMELRGLFPESLQGDSAVKDIFQQLSVQTFVLSRQQQEPRTMLIRRGQIPNQLTWDFTKTPDLAQTLVVTCALKGIAFHFTGLQSLRIKETDRLSALQKELRKLGVQVEVEGDDVMHWAGPQQQALGDVPYLQPVEGTAIDTYQDHRMAMAFAPAALVLGSICINHPEVVSKSYPRFWQDLQEAGFEVREKAGDSFICCGQHAVCEKELLMQAASAPIEYFDDEELDRYRGRASDDYTEEEEEEFREVLMTTLTREVGDWLRSLELRGINLPDGLKDEALLLMNDD